MKKLLVVFLSLSLTVSAMLFCGCGGGPNPAGGEKVTVLVEDATPSGETGNTGEPGTFTAADCVLKINGIALRIGEDFLPNADKVGTPKDIQEGQACLDGGFDTNYYYDGFSVFTLASGGKQLIYDIDVSAAGFSTEKKIVIGTSTEEELIAAYGTPAESAKLRRTYLSGDVMMVFFVENGVVKEIELGRNID